MNLTFENNGNYIVSPKKRGFLQRGLSPTVTRFHKSK